MNKENVNSAPGADLWSWGIVMAVSFAVGHILAVLWQHLKLPDVWLRLVP